MRILIKFILWCFFVLTCIHAIFVFLLGASSLVIISYSFAVVVGFLLFLFYKTRLRIISYTITFITVSLVSGIFFLVFYHMPHVMVTYDKGKWQEEDLEAIRTLQESIYPCELCDPLPCWYKMEVRDIVVLDEPKEMQDNFYGLGSSKRITVKHIHSNKRCYEKKICPADSRIITVIVRKQWWSIFTSLDYLNDAKISFCITPAPSP